MDTTRRTLLGQAISAGLLTLPALAFARGGPSAKRIPQRASVRVIVDNDFSGDPDGLVALAHQLLSPKARTVLLTSSALPLAFSLLDPALSPADRQRTAASGAEIASELCRRLGLAQPPPVAAGAETPGLAHSAAAEAIVREALRDDTLPLLFTCGGPLTNLAAALELEPAIAHRMKVLWIGGGNLPDGGWEYNQMADLEAARRVIERSAVEFGQVPQATYRQMQFSIAEMESRLRPLSPFTEWLYQRFTSPPDFVDLGGTWPMGDTPLVTLGCVSSESSEAHEVTARRLLDDGRYGEEIPGRRLRVWQRVDARLGLEDCLALLALHARPI